MLSALAIIWTIGYLFTAGALVVRYLTMHPLIYKPTLVEFAIYLLLGVVLWPAYIGAMLVA